MGVPLCLISSLIFLKSYELNLYPQTLVRFDYEGSVSKTSIISWSTISSVGESLGLPLQVDGGIMAQSASENDSVINLIVITEPIQESLLIHLTSQCICTGTNATADLKHSVVETKGFVDAGMRNFRKSMATMMMLQELRDNPSFFLYGHSHNLKEFPVCKEKIIINVEIYKKLEATSRIENINC